MIIIIYVMIKSFAKQ